MFWEKLCVMCEIKGCKPNTVAKAIGLSTATATKWKNGATPNGEALKKIADYLDCSVDYLLGRDEDYIENLAKTFNIPVSEVANIEIPKNINEENLDKELIERLSRLSDEDIQRVNDFVAGIISTRDKKGH